MPSWNSEGESRYLKDTKIGQRLLLFDDKLLEIRILGPAYRRMKVIWSRTDYPGATAVWLSGGVKDSKKKH